MITTINEWKKINESRSSDFQQIIDFMENYIGTTLYYNDGNSDDNEIMFTTREHSGDETPGQEDIDDAYKVAKEIKLKWPIYDVNVDIVDEWVHVRVKEKYIDPVYYIFIKHSEEIGSRQSMGFEETYKNVNEFKERMIQFLRISKKRANEIIAKLDTMDINEDIPNYYKKGAVVNIIKKGDVGNNFNYNFSAVKTNKPWY